MDSLADALAGTAGTVVGKLFTYPLDFLKVKVQVSGVGVTPAQIRTEVLQEHGVLGFYQGLGPKLVKSSTQKFIMFFLQRFLGGTYRSIYMQGVPESVPVHTGAYVIISWLGEILGLPIIIPIETVVTRVQTSLKGETAMEVISAIRSSPGGFLSLFRVFPAYIFTCCQPALQYPIFEILRGYMLRGRMQLGWIESFFAGAISKAIAQTITFPFERTRSKFQQLQKSGKNLSPLAVMYQLYKEEGLGFPFYGGLWKGVESDLYQGIVNAALMLMIREQLYNFVKGLVYAFFGVKKR
eukprot:g2342.t1